MECVFGLFLRKMAYVLWREVHFKLLLAYKFLNMHKGKPGEL